jgi:hypothetical protein
MAQTYQGRILGLITGPSGAVIAGAQVSIRNIATGVERSLTTNRIGEYVAADLDLEPARSHRRFRLKGQVQPGVASHL